MHFEHHLHANRPLGFFCRCLTRGLGLNISNFTKHIALCVSNCFRWRWPLNLGPYRNNLLRTRDRQRLWKNRLFRPTHWSCYRLVLAKDDVRYCFDVGMNLSDFSLAVMKCDHKHRKHKPTQQKRYTSYSMATASNITPMCRRPCPVSRSIRWRWR